MRIATFAALLCALCLPPTASFAETHTVEQVNFTFSADEITVQVGDTVEWQWNSGSHTVTSGTGPTDPEVGNLFDASLGIANQIVSVTFDTPGDVPYFCRPHFGLGMTGVVHVEPATPVQSGSWGRVKALFD
jgi:plastocyanin